MGLAAPRGFRAQNWRTSILHRGLKSLLAAALVATTAPAFAQQQGGTETAAVAGTVDVFEIQPRGKAYR